MVAKVAPVPSLPNVSKAPPEKMIQNIILAVTRILIEHASRLNYAVTTDGMEVMTAPLGLAQYATVDLPDATAYEGHILYDSTTNTVKWSNGTVWATI